MTILSEKRVAITSFIIAVYFLILYFLNVFEIDFVIIGVFRELLTIPFLIVQIVFLILGIRFLIRKKIQVLTILGVLVLLVSSIYTFGSFL